MQSFLFQEKLRCCSHCGHVSSLLAIYTASWDSTLNHVDRGHIALAQICWGLFHYGHDCLLVWKKNLFTTEWGSNVSIHETNSFCTSRDFATTVYNSEQSLCHQDSMIPWTDSSEGGSNCSRLTLLILSYNLLFSLVELKCGNK